MYALQYLHEFVHWNKLKFIFVACTSLSDFPVFLNLCFNASFVFTFPPMIQSHHMYIAACPYSRTVSFQHIPQAQALSSLLIYLKYRIKEIRQEGHLGLESFHRHWHIDTVLYSLSAILFLCIVHGTVWIKCCEGVFYQWICLENLFLKVLEVLQNGLKWSSNCTTKS